MPVQLIFKVQPKRGSRTRGQALCDMAQDAILKFTQPFETLDASKLTKSQQKAIMQTDPEPLAAHVYGNWEVLMIHRVYFRGWDVVNADVHVSMIFRGENPSEQFAAPDDFEVLKRCCESLTKDLISHVSSADRKCSISLDSCKFADVYSKPTGVEARRVTFIARLCNTLKDWVLPLFAPTLAGGLLVMLQRKQTGRWNFGAEIGLVLLTFILSVVMAFLACCVCHVRVHKGGGLDYYVTT